MNEEILKNIEKRLETLEAMIENFNILNETRTASILMDNKKMFDSLISIINQKNEIQN